MAAAAAFFALPWLTMRRAHAQNDAVDAIIKKITGGAVVQPGRVKLEIPALADNGNSVSLRMRASQREPRHCEKRCRGRHESAPFRKSFHLSCAR